MIKDALNAVNELAEDLNRSINNSGLVAGRDSTIDITGEYVAGRDQTVNNQTENNYNYTFSEKLNFSEINLSSFEDNKYPLPLFTEQVYQKISDKRVLVVGGNYEYDKSTFINSIAYKLKKPNKSHQVKGWVDRSDNVNLFNALNEESNHTIFVFNDLHPHLLNYDLERLEKIAQRHGHYFLISTDLDVKSWKLPDYVIQSLWFDIPEKELFAKEVLCKYLITEIEKYKHKIKFPFTVENLSITSKLSENNTIYSLAKNLETIRKIDIFLKILVKDSNVVNDRSIDKTLNKVRNNQLDLINQWFSTLGEKQKEIAIVMSIFDGMYDDQFFCSVEKLTNTIWKNRDSNLVGLDYSDLDELLSFFEILDFDNGRKVIRSRYAKQRLLFLDTIWDSHRRQLLSSLKILEELIIESVNGESNWELHGNSARKNRLQSVISETLSDIGMKHLSSVEGTLIRLASSEEDRIQRITAMALARWRKYGKDEQLLKTLDHWQKETRIQQLVKEIFPVKKEAAPNAINFIRATIAITIGYAAQYDKPNQLNESFVGLFESFIDENSSFVSGRFNNFTIPLVLKNHLYQVKDIVFQYIKFTSFHDKIAKGIAQAYERSSEEAYEVIQEWLVYVEINKNDISTNEYKTLRDFVVIVIIRSLAEINYKDEAELNTDVAYEIINRLQKNEHHKPIEKYYFFFVERQLKKNKTNIKPSILTIIENLSYSAREKLTQLLTNLFEGQRGIIKLRHNNNKKNEGKSTVSSTKDLMPKTEIETILMNWMTEDKQTGQEIAIESFYSFAETIELPEKREKERQESQIAAQDKPNELSPRGEREPTITITKPSFWSEALSYITLGKYETHSKKLIKNVLPVMVKKNMINKDALGIMTEKMEQGDNPKLKEMANYFSRFPYQLTKVKVTFAVIGTLLFLLFVFIMV